VSRDQLLNAGLPESQIQIGGLCTKCRRDRFFSYRGEKITGRFPAVIGLRDA
jgi:copper oxidase (laccase) domain-containing protein